MLSFVGRKVEWRSERMEALAIITMDTGKTKHKKQIDE
jgi:hypothetical protein